jgi:hypothetical protein
MKVKDLKSQLDQQEDERGLRLRGRILEVLDERRRVVESIPIRVSTEERRRLGLEAQMRRGASLWIARHRAEIDQRERA